jgi:hypothetical protein
LNFLNLSSHPGCVDVNECAVGYEGAPTRGTHACVRSSDAGQVCYNTEGGYYCGECDVGGAEKMEGQTGTVLSHPSQGHGVEYDNSFTKEWYIKVAVGYHVELTIQDFAVRL